MSALPCQIPAPIDARPFDLADFISVREAARRMNCNRNGLLRDCKDGNLPTGVAVKCDVLSPGRGQWFIARAYDPRLAGDCQESTIAAAEALTGKQRNLMLQRADCARRYRHARLNSREPKAVWLPRLQAAIRQQYPAMGTLGRSTLAKWEDKSDGGKNFMALADRRGGRQSPEASLEAWEAFEDLFLTPKRLDVRHCWKIVKNLAAKNGWRWIYYSQCQRQLDRKVPPEKQMFSRDPERWRTQCAPFIHQDEESWRAGQRWVSDGKTLDLWCTWRQSIIRPVVICWIDWRTRRIVGWHLASVEDSSAILQSFGKAMRDPFNFGGPSEVAIDNGQSYSAFMWHGSTKQERRRALSIAVDEAAATAIYAHLNIEAHFSNPFGPNGKARMERFNRRLTPFARGFDTFCGIDSTSRPEQLADILKNPAKIPTFAEVETRLSAFIENYNDDADHAMDDLSENGVKLSPNEAFSKWCDTRRVMADPAALDLLLAHWHKPVTVGRNGISLTIGGRTARYGHVFEALRPYKAPGRKIKPVVNVSYDPAALETVRVYDSQFRFITVAPMNRVGGVVQGMTKADCAETHRQIAAYRKSLRHQAEYSITSILSTEEQFASATRKRQQAERNAALTATQPTSIIGIRTPLDGQSKQLQKQELKIAVGAESLSEPATPRVDIFEKLAAAQRSIPQARQDRPDLLEQIYGRHA